MAVFRIVKAEIQKFLKIRISGINFYLINLNNYKIFNNAILFILIMSLNFRTNKSVNNNSLNCIKSSKSLFRKYGNPSFRRYNPKQWRHNFQRNLDVTATIYTISTRRAEVPSFVPYNGCPIRKCYASLLPGVESVIGVNTGSNRSRGDISISNHLSEAVYYLITLRNSIYQRNSIKFNQHASSGPWTRHAYNLKNVIVLLSDAITTAIIIEWVMTMPNGVDAVAGALLGAWYPWTGWRSFNF